MPSEENRHVRAEAQIGEPTADPCGGTCDHRSGRTNVDPPRGPSAGKGQSCGLAGRAEIKPCWREPEGEPCSPWQYANVAAMNTNFSVRMLAAMSRAAINPASIVLLRG